MRRLLPAFLLLGLAACQTTGATKTTVDPLDIVSEADFKALHTKNQDEVPALAGHTVEVGGTQSYFAEAAGEGPHPSIIVIHEWWGLTDHIKHWADRLAALGYDALAVDLYGGQVATTPDDALAYMKAVDPAASLAILTAAHAWLVGEQNAQRTGVIGWCFGGGWSLQTALAVPELDAAVIYYGRLETDPTKLAAIQAPLLGIFADQDTGIPPDVVDTFDTALDEAEVDHRILRYDAQHAFANPSGGRYDAKSAEAAWAEVRAFLEARLGGAAD